MLESSDGNSVQKMAMEIISFSSKKITACEEDVKTSLTSVNTKITTMKETITTKVTTSIEKIKSIQNTEIKTEDFVIETLAEDGSGFVDSEGKSVVQKSVSSLKMDYIGYFKALNTIEVVVSVIKKLIRVTDGVEEPISADAPSSCGVVIDFITDLEEMLKDSEKQLLPDVQNMGLTISTESSKSIKSCTSEEIVKFKEIQSKIETYKTSLEISAASVQENIKEFTGEIISDSTLKVTKISENGTGLIIGDDDLVVGDLTTEFVTLLKNEDALTNLQTTLEKFTITEGDYPALSASEDSITSISFSVFMTKIKEVKSQFQTSLSSSAIQLQIIKLFELLEGTEITKDNDDDDLVALLKTEVEFFTKIKTEVASSIATVEKTISSISGKNISKMKSEINKIVDGKIVDFEGKEVKAVSSSLVENSLVIFVQMQDALVRISKIIETIINFADGIVIEEINKNGKPVKCSKKY